MRKLLNDLPIKSSQTLRKELQNTVYGKRTIGVLGIPVDLFTKTELSAFILKLLSDQKRGWISYINVHTIDIANQLPWFKQFIEDALIRYCDGEGVRFGAYLLGERIPERFTLSHFIYDLADLAVEHHLTIFLLGGTPDVAELAAKKLKILYPEIRLSGYHHGFFSEKENDSVIETINASQPDILFLGMGVPKQEAWTRENFEKLNAKLIWMGGGFLDTLSGNLKRCPNWFSVHGFEWLFRLTQEPRRLWKRYLIGNPLFLWRIFKTRLH